MLIDERYFTHPDTRIAGIEIKSDGKPAGPAPQLIDDIHAYIDRYEPKFLRLLLGKDVAGDIQQYPRIIAMLIHPEQATSVIAKYVYFYYSRDHMTFNTVAGEKLKTTERSSGVSPNSRLVHLWNSMVGDCWDIVNCIEDVEICPDFDASIFEEINVFNL